MYDLNEILISLLPFEFNVLLFKSFSVSVFVSTFFLPLWLPISFLQ